MKKLTIALMIFMLSASLFGCGKNKDNEDLADSKDVISENNDSVQDKDKDSNETKDEDDKNAGEAVKDEAEKDTETNKPTNESEDKPEALDSSNSTSNNKVDEKPSNLKPEIVSRESRLYFYNGVEDKIYYQDTKVEVVENAFTKALTEALKNSPSENVIALPDEVGVTSAKIDGDTITVDLGTEFYDFSRGMGSSAEAGILESIALTYSYNYGISNVIILVGGENYSSGHLLFNDGECINIRDVEATPL